MDLNPYFLRFVDFGRRRLDFFCKFLFLFNQDDLGLFGRCFGPPWFSVCTDHSTCPPPLHHVHWHCLTQIPTRWRNVLVVETHSTFRNWVKRDIKMFQHDCHGDTGAHEFFYGCRNTTPLQSRKEKVFSTRTVTHSPSTRTPPHWKRRPLTPVSGSGELLSSVFYKRTMPSRRPIIQVTTQSTSVCTRDPSPSRTCTGLTLKCNFFWMLKTTRPSTNITRTRKCCYQLSIKSLLMRFQ